MNKLEPIPPDKMKELTDTLESHAFVQLAQAKQFRHAFKGYGVHDSSCIVTIFRHAAGALVVLQDIGHGTSVTNASEDIATEVMRLEHLDPERTAWCECYPYYGGNWDIDAITYDWEHYADGSSRLKSPSWKPVRNSVFLEFLRSYLKPTKHEN